MKQTFKLFSMLAAVALTLVACKPDPVEPTDVERNIVYTVDQTTTTVHLNTEAEFDALLDRFCDYAESGKSVSFYNANRVVKGRATKEGTTYSTTSREQMKAWMRQMEDAGKTVTVTYDSQTGTWNGTAYANAPQPQGELLTYERAFNYIWSFDTVNRRVYITLHDNNMYYMAPDCPVGAYTYVPCDEVNNPFTYWLIDTWGDTAGLYYLEFLGSASVGGSDTLHYNSSHYGNPIQLVRTDQWTTYLCTNQGLDIVMHLKQDGREIYPTPYIGQMGVNGLERFDLIWPFGIGRFVMDRTITEDEGIYALTLDFRDFGTNEVLDGFYIQGEPIVDNQFTISHNAGEFTFHRL